MVMILIKMVFLSYFEFTLNYKNFHTVILYIFKSNRVVLNNSNFLSFFYRNKIDQIVEIVTGNPTVIKMVVHFNRLVNTMYSFFF